MSDDEREMRQFASPPCQLHEIDPEFAGTSASAKRELTSEMVNWRNRQRERLIATRLELPPQQRKKMDAGIAEQVQDLLGDVNGKMVGAYWPFRNEPDLKPLVKSLVAWGARTALPMVVSKGRPLVYREWKSGDRLERGVWKIPYPAEGKEVTPDIVIAPVVGFDGQCYRLGYGGGFFDRTLAAMVSRPIKIGVGYSLQYLPAFQPHAHDIPMDVIVTNDRLYEPCFK